MNIMLVSVLKFTDLLLKVRLFYDFFADQSLGWSVIIINTNTHHITEIVQRN